MDESFTSRGPLAALLDGLDQSTAQLLERLDGLGDEEYAWEPVPGCWNVRQASDGFAVDWVRPEPDPAPFTSIAWRLWHIAVDCMDTFSAKAFGSSATGLSGPAWVGDAATATDLTAAAIANFRAGLAAMGDAALGRPLGEAWGAFEHHTYFDLGVHAFRELTHHAAEIGTLRDLWSTRK